MEKDPATLTQEYQGVTQNILSYALTQVGSFGTWQNVPGGLAMIQASTAGYVWGINGAGYVYVCQQPCTGGWKQVAVLTGVKSLQVDDTNAYILATNSQGAQVVYVSPIDGSGSMTPIPIPSDYASTNMASMGVTNTFLWVSGVDSTTSTAASLRCTKPCTTGAWVPDTDITTPLTSMSSSGSKLYGITFDPSLGKSIAFSAEETGDNLEQIAGLAGVSAASINGQSDQTSILTTGTDGTLYGCAAPCSDPSNLYKIDTQGYPPVTTPNATSVGANQIWMVSANNGTNGNVFQRLDVPNPSAILSQIGKMDAQRDDIVKSLRNEAKTQSKHIAVQRELTDAKNALGEALDSEKRLEGSKREEETLKQEIQDQKNQGQGYIQKLYPIQILAIALLGSVIIYAILGRIAPDAAKGLTALALTVGFGATIYFYVTNNTDGQSFIQRYLPTPKS
jgi:hypothetical protein